MKVLVTNYSFNKTASTVTFNGFSSIDLSKVLLITNTTTGEIIYNFASPAKGGTVTNNVLTLEYNTAAMNNTDKLQIYYDDQQTELFYSQALTSNSSITPTAGKRIRVEKIQVMQNPDNTVSTLVTASFVSTGSFITGWAFSDKSGILGNVNEILNITLAGGQPVSVNIRYKEI